MEYTTLGRTGLRVSRLGLGGAQLGEDLEGPADAIVSDVVHTALDLGINFIDTAPLYGRGESERRIGKALKGKRHDVILATKAVMRGDPYSYDNTLQSVEDSLHRLQTDYIDLIQVHDSETPGFDQIMTETVPAFLKLKEQGKVRTIGVNARNLELLATYMKTDVFDMIQFYNRYMLTDYTAKDEVLPLARKMNIGVVNASVLGAGILADTPAPYLRKNEHVFQESYRRMKLLDFLRRKEPHGLVEPAMRFSLGCQDIDITLAGTSSVQQLKEHASYCDGKGLSKENLDKVFALFPGQPLHD